MVFRQAGMVLVVLAVVGVAGGRAQGVKPAAEPVAGIGLAIPGSDPGSARIVQDLAAALADETLSIRSVPKANPVQTVGAMLKDRGTTVGIVPSDMLPYLRRIPRFAGSDGKLRSIAKLSDEEVHVLARRDIASLKDLVGRRVNVGPADSQSQITSSVLFSSLGITVEPMFAEESIALAQLLRGEISALIHVGRKPARLFFDLNREDGVHFLPVPPTPALSQTYAPARLGIADYPLLIGAGEAGRGAPVATVAVPMVLAVADPPPGTERSHALARFTDALGRHAAALKALPFGSPWQEIDLAATIPGWLRVVPDRRAPGSDAGAASRSQTRAPPPKIAASPPLIHQPQKAEQPPPDAETLENFLRSGQ